MQTETPIETRHIPYPVAGPTPTHTGSCPTGSTLDHRMLGPGLGANRSVQSLLLTLLILAPQTLDAAETCPATALTSSGSSLRGYWQYNGNALDSSTWANHGVIRFARYPSGKSGQAISLTGRAGVIVPDAPSLQIERGFSVAVWARLSEWGQTATLIASGDPMQGRSNWQVGLESGLLQVSYLGQDGTTDHISVAESLLPLNTWVNISAWYSADSHELGLVVYGQSLITSQIRSDATGALLRIEPLGLTMGSGFKGNLDEIRLEAPWE